MSFRRSNSIENGFSGMWCSGRIAVALMACLPLLAACGSAGGDGEPDGSIHGELRIYRVDYSDGHSESEFFLAPNEQAAPETRLHFANDPQLQPWTKLKIWGTQTANAFEVEHYEEQTAAVTDDVEVSAEALTKVTKKTHTLGFVLMDIGNGVNISATDASTAAFGTRAATQAGLNQYYNENSYGGLNFSGDVLGPQTVTTIGTCDQQAVTALVKMWPTTFGKTYDHWLQYMGSNNNSCGWSGLGSEGTAARNGTGSWYNASLGCTVLNQEVGHNLGLMHSNSLTCTGAPFADDPQTCLGAEYGDRHTVMGSGCAHLGAYEKWYEGFLGGCNAVRATASGTYTLLPTELPCDGVQALQIPMPKTRPFHNTTGTATVVNLSKYYLELRTKVGIDGKETQAVLVTVGGDVPASNKTSQFTWVLDMDPTTTKTAEGLTAGKSFTDPAGGVSFTVNDIDATHATVNVTVDASTGPATCMDGTAFAGPGPQSCDATGPVGGGGSGGSGGTVGGGGASSGGSSSAGASNGGSSSAGANSGGASSAGASSGGSSSAGANSGGASSGGASSAGSSNAGASNGGASGAGANNGGASGAGAPGSGIAGSFSSGGASGSTAGTGASTAGASAGGSANGSTAARPAPSASDSSGCSCRAAPASPSRSGLASIALLLFGFAFRRRPLRGSTRGDA